VHAQHVGCRQRVRKRAKGLNATLLTSAMYSDSA
jgi:hypothetical protein